MTFPVSVIVPHIPSRKKFFAERALPAIKANEPDEIIVVDEGGNASQRRNAGAKKAKGMFLYFCDDDVVMKPRALSRLVHALRWHSDASFAYGNIEHILHPGGKCANPGTTISRPFDAAALKRYNYISNMSLIRRGDFPGYDERLEKCEDWDLWLTMAARGNGGVYIPETFHESHHIDVGLLASGDTVRWEGKVREKHGRAH